MTETSARDRVLDCFLLVFPSMNAERVTTLSSADAAWDSLAALSLLATLEEEFAVVFSDDEIQSMATFDAVAETVERVLGRDN